MFYKIGKKQNFGEFLFSKNGKFSDVPALKHILTDPALGFFFGSVLHQLQFKTTVCNGIESTRTVACGLPFEVLALIYVVLVVFIPYKMAPLLSVQQHSFFSEVYW